MKSAVGSPVATMTRVVRIRPPAVCTSASRRPNVILRDRRALEDRARRARRPRAPGRAPRGTDRSSRRPARGCRPAPRNPARREIVRAFEQRRVEAGRRGALSARASGAAPARAPRRRRRAERLQRALDVEPAQQRREVEPGAAPRLPGPPRVAQPSAFSRSAKPDAGIVAHPAGTRGRRAAADLSASSSDDLHARRAQRIRRRAAGQSAADDDDVGGAGASVSGIRRHARLLDLSIQGERPYLVTSRTILGQVGRTGGWEVVAGGLGTGRAGRALGRVGQVRWRQHGRSAVWQVGRAGRAVASHKISTRPRQRPS